jgi:alanine racemase
MTRRNEHRTWVEVSKRALVSNARQFQAFVGPSTAVMAVVKANAYGHGLLETAKSVATEVAWFGVDNLGEAEILKKAKLKKPILILGWTPSWQLPAAIRAGFRLTVSTVNQVKEAATAAKAVGKKAFLHLKIDTGTTRQGADLRQLPDLTAAFRASKRLVVEGLSTHYANVEDTSDRSYAALQLSRYEEAERFLDAQGVRPSLRHTASTAAALVLPAARLDLVRVGIGLYGLWPSRETKVSVAGESAHDFELTPALAWRTRIALVREVKRGTPVSYGLTETMKTDGRVAVLPVGYWDGYDRGLSSIGEVLVRGQRARIIGRVCMNMMMIDVTNIPNVKAYDIATLIGTDGRETVTAEELAAKCGTVNYEVVTRINPILPRIII